MSDLLDNGIRRQRQSIVVDVLFLIAVQLKKDQKLSNQNKNSVVMKLIPCNLVKNVVLFY